MECAKRQKEWARILMFKITIVTYLRQLFRIGLVFGNTFYHKMTKRIPVIRRKIEGLQEK